jgi:hypothetical protein
VNNVAARIMTGLAGGVTAVLAACGSTPAPGAPAAPLAVVEAVPFTAGSYSIAIVNAQGQVEASATATTPSYYSGSWVALTGASDSRVYYEDGNSNIDYLTPNGQRGVAMSITSPAGSAVAFAVAPDGSQVAVSVLQDFAAAAGAAAATAPTVTSHMYLVPMGGGAERSLYNGTSASGGTPLTWPVGWDGSDLVVAQVLPADFGGISGQYPCATAGVGCASQMRTFDPATGAFGPALCAGSGEELSGAPTPAGIACQVGAPPSPEGLAAYTWSGARTAFATGVTLESGNACMLSPDGSQILCPTVIENAETDPQVDPARMFARGGALGSVPSPDNAQVLGWIDAHDVVVATGNLSEGLAVENLTTGRQIPFSVPSTSNRWKWVVAGVLPGAL